MMMSQHHTCCLARHGTGSARGRAGVSISERLDIMIGTVLLTLLHLNVSVAVIAVPLIHSTLSLTSAYCDETYAPAASCMAQCSFGRCQFQVKARYVDGERYMFQRHVVCMPDAGIIKLCSFDLVLGHFLRRRKRGERQEGSSHKHIDWCLERTGSTAFQRKRSILWLYIFSGQHGVA
jgi:hypothetical protein